MPKKQDKKRERTRVILLIIIGGVACVVSIYINIVGMRNAINKAPDSSGMAAISVRTNDGALKNTDDSKDKKEDSKKIKETDLLVNCVPVINLINNDWDRLQAGLKGFTLDDLGNAVYDDGYTLYCNGTYVNYVVFNKKFEKEVIGNCRVGDDLKDVKKNLGTPTFSNDGLVGYKTREVYAFFYEDEIVIYPNRTMNNSEFENAINSYKDKIYGKDRTYFLADIRQNYPDFEITEDQDNNVITITSLTRQVIAKLDGLENIDVEFYNGYNFALDTTKKYIEENMYTQNKNDLVEQFEIERINGR